MRGKYLVPSSKFYVLILVFGGENVNGRARVNHGVARPAATGENGAFVRKAAGNTMLPYCIRHGESTCNAQGRVQGHLNIRISRLEIDGAIVRRYTLIDLCIENEPLSCVAGA